MTLRQAFIDQAATCTHMGSPFTGDVLTTLAENWDNNTPLGRKFAAFSGDIGPAGHSLPLRMAAGLHALVLTGQDAALAASYPPNETSPAALRTAILGALSAHEGFLDKWTDSAPQTNEVRRSAALIAGAQVAAKHFDLPITLSELGASAGLNLMWDHYALDLGDHHFGHSKPAVKLSPDWRGPIPPDTRPRIASRAGVDLNPLDPKNPEHLLRLSAYIWADQPERLTMTHAAATICSAQVAHGDAIEWLATRLPQAPEGHLHLIQHTVAWQYFPPAVQNRGRALIESAGAKATANRPLAWLSMETDGDKTGKVGAALTLRLWPGDLTLNLGRADFHGRWVEWAGIT